MEWLFILGLIGWAWWQSQKIAALSRQIAALEQRLAAHEAPPLLLTTPAPEAEPEDVLVLDTPVPAASNDEAADGAMAEAAPGSGAPLAEAEPPAPPRKQARKLEQWLAENGLAWLGGGALALGGALLIAIAAQQSWFTPQVRLIAAALLGVALVGAGEWVLRRPNRHKLAAGLLAGAGVAVLYIAAWGAHALYGFIDWRGAAALLSLVALSLFALSFRHGQPLGVLAVLAAMLAPPLTGLEAWPSQGLTLYVCAAGAAGFALAGFKRWAWTAAAALAGLYFWFAAAIALDETRRALALLSFAAVGGVALAFRRPLPEEAATRLSWRQTHTLAPAIAICVSSAATILIWLAMSTAASGAVAGPAWVGAMFVALAAAAVRARVASAATLAVAIGALALGFIAYLRARAAFGPLSPDFYPFILFAVFVIVASAIGAKPHRRDRVLIAGAGAVSAALLVIFAAFSRPEWHSLAAWAPLFIGAATLLAAAWISARDAPAASLPTDFWAGAGAALLLLGVESLFPAAARAAGHAGSAFLLAAGYSARGWRALSWAALAAAALSIGHGLSGALISTALSGALADLGRALLTLTAAALLLASAAGAAERREPRGPLQESLSSAAIIIVLIGAFLLLRWLAAGGVGAGLDPFTEAALGALTLLAAGQIMLPRAAQARGAIAKWRGHALMGAGVFYGLGLCGATLHPWWGAEPAPLGGPPLLDALSLAFVAPGAFCFFAAHRLYPHQRNAARLYGAAGALFALIWAVTEIRRAIHGADMAIAAIGVFEGALYGLLALASALAIALTARWRKGPLGADLSRIMRASAWAGMGVAGVILLLVLHPWWGLQSDTARALGLAVLAQAGAAGLALALARTLSQSTQNEPTRFAAATSAALYALSFGHCAIRWAYHRGAMMGETPLYELEGLAHAFWPLALVLLGAYAAARANDGGRAYIGDLQALWAHAVWPALAFTALGLWLLFNPWWGLAPAHAGAGAASALCILFYVAAAGASALSARMPQARKSEWLAPIARAAATIHFFIAAVLIVRAGFHGGAILPGAAAGVELWTYSALGALYGAGALGLGVLRADAVLRWCGLALLLGAAMKVFLLDMSQLSGVIRVASFLGLGVVLMGTALAMRRFGRTPPRRNPQDLLTVIPGAGRGKPHAPR